MNADMGKSMTLSDLHKLLGAQLVSRTNARSEVLGVSLYSREIRLGWVFVAVPGTNYNGVAFAEDAIRRGAIAIVAEEKVRVPAGIAMLTVPDSRYAAALLAHTYFGKPSNQMRVVGITGTNGKTTSATLLKAVLRSYGEPTGMLGTIAYEIGDRSIAATRTTPDCISLQQLLQGMVKAGCKAAVLEVSSHALAQKRTTCVDFAAVGFTNLTQDHLDYHHTMEAYFHAKASLFRDLPAGRTGVVNVDDAWGARLAQEPLSCDVLRVGFSDQADVQATVQSRTLDGSTFVVRSPWGTQDVQLQLPGIHNVHNALLTFALAGSLGLPPESIAAGLQSVRVVRGRLQRIASTAPFAVFVDYAHTDDALTSVLQELRNYTRAKLRVVFGCGGGRDTEKRAKMGHAVYANSDVAYITSDNPRNEEPEAIIAAVREAFPPEAAVVSEVDRRAAIRMALSEAGDGDTVCIAGKGHESYQEVEGRMLPFNDVDVAQEILQELGYEVS